MMPRLVDHKDIPTRPKPRGLRLVALSGSPPPLPRGLARPGTPLRRRNNLRRGKIYAASTECCAATNPDANRVTN
eukprot:1383838-Prymnesium_polylepis.1